MPYCSRCGVEVYENAEKCPLCQSPIQKFVSDPTPGRPFPQDELASPRPPRMNKKERIHLASVLTGFGLLIPILITLSVDLNLNGTLTWSYYPSIILAAILLIVLTSLYVTKYPGRLIWIIFLIIWGTIFLLSSFTNLPDLAWSTGFPIVFFAAICSHLTVIISSKSKRKGANVAAFIIIAIGLFCFLSDLQLSFRLKGKMAPGWSFIVLAATQPVALILLYLHYRKDKGSKLKKYFHI
jgi:hypothetical protein